LLAISAGFKILLGINRNLHLLQVDAKPEVTPAANSDNEKGDEEDER
jgi:hypothetical protein